MLSDKAVSLIYKVKPSDIVYVSNIISSYDGIAVVKTIDPMSGLLEILTTEECKGLVDNVLKAINLEKNNLAKPRGSFFIYTMGCQMNEYDSEYIIRSLVLDGWKEVQDPKEADIAIINTCSVREKPEQKTISLLGRLEKIKKQKPTFIIGVIGCLSQHKGMWLWEKFQSIDFLLGPSAISNINSVIERVLNTGKREYILSESGDIPALLNAGSNFQQGRVCAYVTIMQGCNNYCAYCVVPYTRGRERSRDCREILYEIKMLSSEGTKEVTLLGQNVNSYLWDDNGRLIRFHHLLYKIAEQGLVKRIRFTTSHPKDLTKELIQCFVEIPSLCKHIHLPFQAGSNKILKAMNRGYTREDYFNLIERLREAVPEISITTDVMVGFPGETQEDFQQTLDLMEKVRFDLAYSFKYSDREGTKAYFMPEKVEEAEKLRRLQVLQGLQQEITIEKNRELVGKRLEILVEGRSKDGRHLMGRATNNKIVNFPPGTEKVGDIVPVYIVEACKNSLKGVSYGTRDN